MCLLADDDTFVSAEHKLISTILDPDKYDPIVRPAKKFDDVVKVTLDATVVTIENIVSRFIYMCVYDSVCNLIILYIDFLPFFKLNYTPVR